MILAWLSKGSINFAQPGGGRQGLSFAFAFDLGTHIHNGSGSGRGRLPASLPDGT